MEVLMAKVDAELIEERSFLRACDIAARRRQTG